MHKSAIDWDNVGLSERIEAGQSSTEVGEDLGVPDYAVRNAANRRGLSFKTRPQVRSFASNIIKDLAPIDAVEALLDMIEELATFVVDDTHEIRRWGIDWTPSEARIVSALFDGDGRVLSRDAIYSVLFFDRPEADRPEPKIIDIHMFRIRQKLLDVGSKYSIYNRFGFGWWMAVSGAAK